MDIFSHGLWGAIAFGRNNRRSFLLSFLFGVLPDLAAFAPFFITNFFGITKGPDFSDGPPNIALIPTYVFQLYSFSHSFVIFSLVFFAAWIFFRRPIWELSAWGLHILFDIPTHSYQFFPTPFLWPISDLEVNGIPWGHPMIFIPNITLLAVLYVYFFVYRKRKYRSSEIQK